MKDMKTLNIERDLKLLEKKHWEECWMPPYFCYCLLWREAEPLLFLGDLGSRDGPEVHTQSASTYLFMILPHTSLPTSPTVGQTRWHIVQLQLHKHVTSSYTIPKRAIPPNSLIYFARLYRKRALNVWVCWRNSTRLGDWRNTQFVTLGKSPPLLSPQLVWGDIGFLTGFHERPLLQMLPELWVTQSLVIIPWQDKGPHFTCEPANMNQSRRTRNTSNWSVVCLSARSLHFVIY